MAHNLKAGDTVMVETVSTFGHRVVSLRPRMVTKVTKAGWIHLSQWPEPFKSADGNFPLAEKYRRGAMYLSSILRIATEADLTKNAEADREAERKAREHCARQAEEERIERIMRAGPDLLAVLKDIDAHGYSFNNFDAVRAAIAKAEGRE